MFLHSVGLPNGVQCVSCAGQADVDVTPNSEEVAAVKHVDLQVCQLSGRGELPGCAGRGEEGQATGAAEGCGSGRVGAVWACSAQWGGGGCGLLLTQQCFTHYRMMAEQQRRQALHYTQLWGATTIALTIVMLPCALGQ